MSMTQTATVDFDAIKQRQQGTWSSGDYAVIGTTLQIIGESLCEAVDVAAGERVLDVAAGNGNASLAAARRGCEVDRDRLRAGAARRDARPGRGRGPDDRGPRGRRRGAAVRRRQLRRRAVDVRRDVHARTRSRPPPSSLRVCRPGGRIGLANWTPEGFIGQMFKIVGRYVPPPGRRPLAARVGHRGAARRALRRRRPASTVQRREFVFRYRSAEHWLDAFRDLLRPDPQGVRRPRRGRPGRVRRRAAGPRQQPQHVDHRHPADPERVPRGRRRQGALGGR